MQPDILHPIMADSENTIENTMDNPLLSLVSTIVADSQSDIAMEDAHPDADSDLETHDSMAEAATKVATEPGIDPKLPTPMDETPVGIGTAPDSEMQYDDPVEESESGAGSANETQQRSRLLTLPTEVFQAITWYMDVGTFFASFLTCRQFIIAARSKPLLLRHIQNIPGLQLGLEDLATEKLLDLFSRRAAESGCGASVLADVTKYAPTSKTPVSNAVFSPCTWLPFAFHLLPSLSTHTDEPTLQIVSLTRFFIYVAGQHSRIFNTSFDRWSRLTSLSKSIQIGQSSPSCHSPRRWHSSYLRSIQQSSTTQDRTAHTPGRW